MGLGPAARPLAAGLVIKAFLYWAARVGMMPSVIYRIAPRACSSPCWRLGSPKAKPPEKPRPRPGLFRRHPRKARDLEGDVVVEVIHGIGAMTAPSSPRTTPSAGAPPSMPPHHAAAAAIEHLHVIGDDFRFVACLPIAFPGAGAQGPLPRKPWSLCGDTRQQFPQDVCRSKPLSATPVRSRFSLLCLSRHCSLVARRKLVTGAPPWV